MAIALHGSSPALVSEAGSSAATASFSPPAQSLLVAMLAAFSGNGVPGLSGGGLTWTRRVRQNTGGNEVYAEIWTAPCPSGATNITITATANDVNFPSVAVKVDVYTGADLTTPHGNSGSGTSTTNAINPTGYTSSQAGSRGVIVAASGDGSAPTSTDDESAFADGNGFSGLAARKNANTGSSGVAVTFNLDAAGAGAVDWRWAALEIRASSLDATVDATTVTASGDVPVPGLHAGATASPDVVEAAGEIPEPGLHAGQTAHATTVTASADIPAPNVIAGSAELVEPVTVTASADIPSPGITAISNATVVPGVVEAAGEAPDPAVTATFQVIITPGVVEAVGEVPSPGVAVPTLPGDNITDVGQVELNGVVWGTGTPYRIREITGWEELPPIDDLSEEEPGRDGAYAGLSLSQRRTVTVALQLNSISDPTQVDALLRQLRYDTRVLRDNTLWTFVAKGYTDMRLGYCKVTDRTGVMGGDYNVGAPEPVITLVFPDPRMYELDQQSVVAVANAPSPTEVINAGDKQTNPVLRFAGPAVNPMLVNETLDRILAFDITLSGGEILVVDTNRGKALIGATDHGNDISDTISVPIKEFFFDVGTTGVSYETDSGGDAGVEILWRSAFL